MKFKDVFARWAKETAGRPQPRITTEDIETVTRELEELISFLDMDQNTMRFKDLAIKTKTVETYNQEVTFRITFNKSGNGALILKPLLD